MPNVQTLTRPTVANSAKAELWFLDSRVHIAMAQVDNPDGISFIEHRMPYGSAPPLHVHHDEDEIFHILEGEMEFELGGERFVRRAGDTLIGPRGVPHRFRVVSPGGVRLLTISRGGFEDMIRATSQPAPGPGLPEQRAPTPEEQQALATACAARGIDIVGPPLA